MTTINREAWLKSAVANNNAQNLKVGVYPLLNGLKPSPELNTIDKIKAYAAIEGPVIVNNSDVKYIVMPTGDSLILSNAIN